MQPVMLYSSYPGSEAIWVIIVVIVPAVYVIPAIDATRVLAKRCGCWTDSLQFCPLIRPIVPRVSVTWPDHLGGQGMPFWSRIKLFLEGLSADGSVK
jgi:hypothetical protein